MLYFCMLGELEIQGPETAVELLTPKLAGLLALLMCMPNQIVNTFTLIDELWGENPPKTANATTQTYIYKLRKLFGDLDPGWCREDFPLETRAPGYILHVGEDQVDAFRFERLAGRGSSLLAQGRTEEAVVALSNAIALWRGYPLSNAAYGQVVQSHIAGLQETFIRTCELHIQGLFALGRHDETIDDLTVLTRRHPLNEWVHARLMQALHLCGRGPEAQRVYRALASRLDEELGIEPSPALQHLAGMTAAPVPAVPDAPAERCSADRRA